MSDLSRNDPRPLRSGRSAGILAIVFMLALVALGLGWELRWAPLRPGGSWLVLKVLPLLAALPGMLRGRRYTAQWSAMLVLAYMAEGIVRAMTESGPSRNFAVAEIVLAVGYFAAAVAFVRLSRGAALDRSGAHETGAR